MHPFLLLFLSAALLPGSQDTAEATAHDTQSSIAGFGNEPGIAAQYEQAKALHYNSIRTESPAVTASSTVGEFHERINALLALARKSNNELAYDDNLAMAEAAEEISDYETSRMFGRRTFEQKPAVPKSYSSFLRSSLNSGDIELAESVLADALKVVDRPESLIDFYYLISRRHISRNQFKNAAGSFRKLFDFHAERMEESSRSRFMYRYCIFQTLLNQESKGVVDELTGYFEKQLTSLEPLLESEKSRGDRFGKYLQLFELKMTLIQVLDQTAHLQPMQTKWLDLIGKKLVGAKSPGKVEFCIVQLQNGMSQIELSDNNLNSRGLSLAYGKLATIVLDRTSPQTLNRFPLLMQNLPAYVAASVQTTFALMPAK